jgi:hypothetical protein
MSILFLVKLHHIIYLFFLIDLIIRMSIKRINSIESNICSPRLGKKIINRNLIDEDDDEDILNEESDKRITRSQVKASRVTQPKSISILDGKNKSQPTPPPTPQSTKISNSEIIIQKGYASRKVEINQQQQNKRQQQQNDVLFAGEKQQLDEVAAKEYQQQDVQINAASSLRQEHEQDEILVIGQQQHVEQRNKSPIVQQNQEQNRVVKQNEMGNSFKSILNYLLKQAEDKKFPQKTFIFDKIKKNYNCALNFFECQTIFTNKPTGRIEFTCLGCEKIYHARIGRTGNLNRHLNSHQEQKLRKWIQLYDAWNTKCQHSKITAGVMIMVRYFITSNVALNE